MSVSLILWSVWVFPTDRGVAKQTFMQQKAKKEEDETEEAEPDNEDIEVYP